MQRPMVSETPSKSLGMIQAPSVAKRVAAPRKPGAMRGADTSALQQAVEQGSKLMRA